MTYREPEDAWLLRREALVRALVSESDLDVREGIAVELERIDRARRMEARRRLPVVARATIASPCHEPFEAMSGGGAIRSCAKCDREVFDLAQMTLAQAEALIASRGGESTCVRLKKRLDGTMMFADCDVGARGVRTRQVGMSVAAAVIAGVAIAWMHAPPAHAHAMHGPESRRAVTGSGGVRVLYGAPPSHDVASPYDGQTVTGLMSRIPLTRFGAVGS